MRGGSAKGYGFYFEHCRILKRNAARILAAGYTYRFSKEVFKICKISKTILLSIDIFER